MHTPSKLALSFVHTKIVQYGQKRMDFRYMIYGLDKIPQDPPCDSNAKQQGQNVILNFKLENF